METFMLFSKSAHLLDYAALLRLVAGGTLTGGLEDEYFGSMNMLFVGYILQLRTISFWITSAFKTVQQVDCQQDG